MLLSWIKIIYNGIVVSQTINECNNSFDYYLKDSAYDDAEIQ